MSTLLDFLVRLSQFAQPIPERELRLAPPAVESRGIGKPGFGEAHEAKRGREDRGVSGIENRAAPFCLSIGVCISRQVLREARYARSFDGVEKIGRRSVCFIAGEGNRGESCPIVLMPLGRLMSGQGLTDGRWAFGREAMNRGFRETQVPIEKIFSQAAGLADGGGGIVRPLGKSQRAAKKRAEDGGDDSTGAMRARGGRPWCWQSCRIGLRRQGERRVRHL